MASGGLLSQVAVTHSHHLIQHDPYCSLLITKVPHSLNDMLGPWGRDIWVTTYGMWASDTSPCRRLGWCDCCCSSSSSSSSTPVLIMTFYREVREPMTRTKMVVHLFCQFFLGLHKTAVVRIIRDVSLFTEMSD